MIPSDSLDDDPDRRFDASMLALVAQAVGFIVAIYEIDDDLIYLSDQWSLLTRAQATPVYLSAQEFNEAIHPDDSVAVSSALGKCRRGESENWDVELRVRAVSGEWRRLMLRARITGRSEFGAPQRIMGAMFDITGHHQASGASEVPDEVYRSSFEQSINGILLGTPEGGILRANPAACRISGYTEAELIGLGRDGLIDTSDGRLAGFLTQRRYLGKSRASVALIQKGGRSIEVELSSVLFTDSHGLRKNVITLSPATENGSAERSLHRVTKMYEARKQCSKAIILSKSRDAMLSEVCRVAVTSQNLALAWYGTVDPATLAVVPLTRHGDEAEFLDAAYFSADARVDEGRGPVGRALRENRAQTSNDFLRDPEAEPWRLLAGRHGMRSMAVLPIGEGGEQLGVLVLHARELDFFDPQLLELLIELAQEISFGLENLQRDADLHESEARFRTLWETALDAIVILDAQSVIHYANPAVTSLFGYRIEEIIGRNFCQLYPPAQGAAHERAMQRYLSTPRPGRRWRAVNSIGRHKDGHDFQIEITFSDVIIDGTRRFIGYVRDVTKRKQAEQLSRKQNNILRRIAGGAGLEPTLEAIARMVEGELDKTSCLFLVNGDSASSFTHCIAPSLPAAVAKTLLAGDIANPTSPALAAAQRREPVMLAELSAAAQWPDAIGEMLLRDVRGLFCWPVIGRSTRLLGVMVMERRDPGVLEQSCNRVVQLALDLAGVAIESRKSEDMIRHLAHCDELTGLANRASLIQTLERSIARARRGEGQLGILFVDLDRFKLINDTIGHEAGDTVLREVARRLQDVVRKGDHVARWGGDEFIVMIEQYVDVGTLTRVADKLINAISMPIAVGELQCQLTASIGICTWPDDGPDLQSLLRHADLAMYRSKEQGRNSFRFYSAQMGASSLERTRLESGLRQAVEKDELVLHFQPKLDLLSGEITGVEALVRWQHPQQGLIWPLKFIEIAEETGHIVAIGRMVLRKACRQMRAWQAAGLTSGRIAVNLSARQLVSESLLSDVAGALEESGLPPGMLELEITESMLMNNVRTALKLLGELRSMGVHLSMDDFGTGYSSLANLKRYPIDSVKIDRSLIRDLPHDGNDAAIAEAVVAMAHALKLRVVAEGVETEAQLNFLHAKQCDEIQGYYFSRPVAADVLEDFMRRYVSSDRIRLALQGGQGKIPDASPMLPSRDLG